MNKFGEKFDISQENPVILELDIQEFIANRKISPEDFGIVEKLASFPKNLLIAQLHNFFNLNKERSVSVLEVLIESTKDKQRKDLYETALSFVRRYDWTASFNLIRVLERR